MNPNEPKEGTLWKENDTRFERYVKVVGDVPDDPFSLPCRYEAILKVLRRGSTRTPLADLEAKAKRVAWRQLLRWIEAQLALVSTEMVTAGEVFMPYMQVRDGRTLYQLANESGFKMLDMK